MGSAAKPDPFIPGSSVVFSPFAELMWVCVSISGFSVFGLFFSFFNFINLVLSYSHTGVAARLCYLISISGQGLARLGAAHGPAEFWPGFPV